MEKIEYYLMKSLFGFDVLRTSNGNPKDRQVIGRLLDLNPLVEYLHLAKNYAPTCKRKDGIEFRVPLGETVHMFNGDRLYFLGNDKTRNYVEIKASGDNEKYMPIVSEN